MNKIFDIHVSNISLTEMMKVSRGGLLMDLSKAFVILYYDLLITNLHAYGFGLKTMELLHSYLTKRWQRTKINSSLRTWSELL